jgi:exoribonuclease II
MLKSIQKIFLLFTIVVFIFTLLYGLKLYFEPVKIISEQKTDIILSDSLLFSDFNNDNILADKRYRNKIIEISAIVKKTEVNDSTFNIIIDNGGNYIIIASCIAEIKNELLQINENSKLKIKGIYTGYIINDETFMIPAEIKIDKCTLVK